MITDSSLTRKRILVLTSTFPRWENDREPPFVFELSKRLTGQFNVMVLAPHAPGAKLKEEIAGIKIYRFRYFFTNRQTLAYEGGILAKLKANRWNYFLVPFFIFSEFFSLLRLLKTSNIDAIHAHWIIPQGMVAIAARAFSSHKPVIICTSHGSDLFGLSGLFFSWTKKQIIKRTEILTVVSHAMNNYVAAIATAKKIEVIPMGVDLISGFSPRSQQTQRSSHELLFVGRLVSTKGLRYLILAMPEILKAYPAIHLLIAGDGPDRIRIEQLATATKVASHIEFLGAVDSISLQDLYRRATVFVAPSEQEGLGLASIEALGCECAVVAADLPAIQDVIIDNITGVICKQRDSKDLALKIITLLGNKELCEKLGRAGRNHVLQNFDWQIIANRYKNLIDTAITKTQ